MARQGVERRLAAILSADVVGYSRLMGADEIGTLNRLNGHRAELIDPTIAEHKGRIVKLMGDGALVEFPSVVDAVECAVAIQRGMAGRNAGVPGNERINFRIGVNLGDIIIEGEDIYGDGVNVAARLQEIAETGGVCLSGTVHDHVMGKVDLAFEDTGEQHLKNIDAAVRVYRVSSDPSVAAPAVPKADADTLPNRPAIAVLPFTVVGGDRDREDFADGLGADINMELSRSGMIVVVGHQVSRRHSLETESIRDIGRALAVGYLLSGSVRHAGDRVRINTEMLEVRSGHPRWSERYDRSLDNPFDVQEEISRKIAGAVEPALFRSEMDRISRSAAGDLQPNELMLRAWRTSDEGHEDGNRAAQLDCEEAIRRDPHYSDAYSQLAWIHWYDAANGWTDDPDKAFRKMLEYADRALSLNPKDYDALGARGEALICLGKFETVLRVIEELTKKFPNHAEATRYRAELMSQLGQHQEALELIQYSMEINPEHDHWSWAGLGSCLFYLERFADAVDAFEQFKVKSKFPTVSLYLAAAYAAAGRKEDARAEIGSLSMDVEKFADRLRFRYQNPIDRERLKIWVQRAAMPE